MSAFDHRWLSIPPALLGRPIETPVAMDAFVAALNVDDVGGAGWKFAGMLPNAIIVVRERPPVGAFTEEQQAAAVEKSASVSRKK